jgi:capsular polysaccharide biosynthesis protein
MSARQKIALNEIRAATDSWQNAHEALKLLWRGKLLIIGAVTCSFLLASIGVVLYGLRYTSEAIVQVDFEARAKTESAKGQPSVPMDAIALIDSEARLIRSRAAAGAVVDGLHLDQDPYFIREPLVLRALSGLRAVVGLPTVRPSARDLAIAALMRRMIVTVEPRSYVIAIAVTTSEPQQAAIIANGVAEEYLSREKSRRLADERMTSERALADLSSVYGARHPNYVLERERISRLQRTEKTAFSKENETLSLFGDERFLPAEAVLIPSGPNVPLILGLVVTFTLASTIWIVLRLGSTHAVPRPFEPNVASTTVERTLFAVRKMARPRLAFRRIAVVLALIGGALFLWGLVQASSSLFKGLAV